MNNNDIALMEKMMQQAVSAPSVTAEEFETLFDSGESVAAHIDKTSAEYPVRVCLK
ncbi:MAG: hypothetical protein IJA79_07935 [Desulfovibrio sp.]|nr:hypothetical protein [Desulfovibrio sp.]